MQPTRAHAWIFLAVSDEPVALTDLIGVAEAINHALPTREELQNSLGWLKANGFIAASEHIYQYTEKGAELRSSANASQHSMAGTWEFVENVFVEIDDPAQATEEISSQAYDEGVKAYEKWFQDTYKLLTGK